MAKKTKKSFSGLGQLTIPLIAIAILLIFNLIRDPSFFSIVISHNNDGNAVLAGNLITASPLHHPVCHAQLFL